MILILCFPNTSSNALYYPYEAFSGFYKHQIKYSGYIDKESSNAEKLNALENISIPTNFDYSRLKCLSSEAKSKLEKIKPVSLSQASRISGVSPADISAMLVFMGR